jgi:hypothetical protein
MATSFQLLDSFRGGELINRSSTVPKDIIERDYNPLGQGTETSVADDRAITPATDTRVRLRAMLGQEEQVYGPAGDPDNLLSILHPGGEGTNGLLFPYTPSIAFSQGVNYKDLDMVHTNGDIAAYQRTPSVTLRVNGDFIVQNQREGQYALAVIHFLRTVSKMYFGEKDAKANKAGLPPPVLIFDGYGNYMFNNLPVILLSHSYSFEKDMNMVSVSTASGFAKVPTKFSIDMELKVQQTPRAMRKDFSLDDFRTGKLLRQGASGNGKESTGWL